ncbi:adventurous gliding motility protein AgmC, partial [Hyalangium sp.]|uniref:adventurous gliding motility protein AgmC n=1 Tax=Hyalangium sp. TaxID=2028555 RepID=UPI002D311200
MKNASSKNILRNALLAVTLCALPALAGPDNVGLGTGRDGPLTVNAANVVINAYTQVTAPLAPGDTAIQVSSNAGFAAGDLVMVLQTTGIVPEPPSGGPSPIDLASNPVGRWEFARLSSVAGTTLNLTVPLLYSYAGSVTQVIRVPEYTTVTINAGRSISPAPWNGSTGGVVAFLANGTFSNGGSVDARGQGFRGGQPVDDPSGTTDCTGVDEAAPGGGQKGEGIAVTRYGVSVTGRGRGANGGGGGVCLKSGGGGGGNGGVGGQGGNTDLNLDGNRAVGGEGGAALTYPALSHLTLGGGGGAGHSTEVVAGAGGGIIFIRASSLTLPGSFFANGNTSNSATDAGSGGGAGGTISLRIAGAATCGTIQAAGGAGGSTGSIAIGPGGGGAGGHVLFQKGSGTCNLTGTAVLGANPGNQLDPGAPGGASYGATAGANGISTVLTGGFPVLPPPVVVMPADGSLINDSTPTYSGTIATPLPAGTEVVIFVDGVEVGRVTPDGAGSWSFTPVAPLLDGSHTVNALAINASQGVQSELSNTNTFTLDATPPAAPVVSTPADGSSTNDNTPTYTGTAEAGSTVTVIVDGAPVGTVTADASGNWSFTQPGALTDGSHTVSATATDAAGNTSPSSNTNTFIVDTLAPAAPVVTAPADGTVTSDNTPTYSSTAEAGSTVTVMVDGVSVGTVVATAAGTWSLTPAAS